MKMRQRRRTGYLVAIYEENSGGVIGLKSTLPGAYRAIVKSVNALPLK